ncbi:MBL fold metallo-hydrolase [Chlorobaculum limnaeum]|uniref:MBL fold metallo-hydrolase n=1 Tax=Chlorobaculum limnaeum TaxID=274537 RepID=A0A1D8D085_CHLLM|nr:hydroxyacylglutathione hydrolase family protein [Chlorobaculum limnaeum]AOS84606.1 MBL fold metallo-hydrolase [Chlorobaculum limnaeum]
MGMQAEQIRTGGDRNFGYLCADEATGEAFAVDSSYSPKVLVDAARQRGWRLVHAFCTHGHGDHTNGNAEFERLTGLRVLLFGDRDARTGIEVAHGASFPLGEGSISIIHTPGHTPDSICILAGDVLFTGDTLFVGKVGGTWSEADARLEYRSLHERLMTLPSGTNVFPGHDYGIAPVSTIGHEKITNPFLLQSDVEAFVDLKNNWAAYKKAHGIS